MCEVREGRRREGRSRVFSVIDRWENGIRRCILLREYSYRRCSEEQQQHRKEKVLGMIAVVVGRTHLISSLIQQFNFCEMALRSPLIE
jgi:hypothetical protein